MKGSGKLKGVRAAERGPGSFRGGLVCFLREWECLRRAYNGDCGSGEKSPLVPMPKRRKGRGRDDRDVEKSLGRELIRKVGKRSG